MLSTIGLVCFAVLPLRIGVPGYVMALALITPGFQLFLAANNTAALARSAEDQRGVISGLLGLARNLGLTAGASLMPTLFVALLGDENVGAGSPLAIGRAFAGTYLLAAGWCALLFLASFRGSASGRSDPPDLPRP